MATEWFIDKQEVPKNPDSTYQTAKRMADGVLELERIQKAYADVKASLDSARLRPAKGDVVVRYVSLTVRDTVPVHDTATVVTDRGETLSVPCPDVHCPDVRVNLALTKGKNGERVIASSSDGFVYAGLDVPIEGASGPVIRKWALGALYSPFPNRAGLFVDRDLMFLRTSLSLSAPVNSDLQEVVKGIRPEIRLAYRF